MSKRTMPELLTAYANLSFDAGRWAVDPKTRRRYERAKDRADRLRERIVTLYMKAAYGRARSRPDAKTRFRQSLRNVR